MPTRFIYKYRATREGLITGSPLLRPKGEREGKRYEPWAEGGETKGLLVYPLTRKTMLDN
jgi:hypothetical protein